MPDLYAILWKAVGQFLEYNKGQYNLKAALWNSFTKLGGKLYSNGLWHQNAKELWAIIKGNINSKILKKIF